MAFLVVTITTENAIFLFGKSARQFTRLSHKSNDDKFHLRFVTPKSPEGDFKLLSSLKSLSEHL